MAEADCYGQSGRDGWHEREIVRQFEYIGNRQGESDVAVKDDVLFLATAHLCTPLACQCVFMEEDHREASANFYGSKVRPGDAPLEFHVRKRQGDLTVLMNARLRRLLTRNWHSSEARPKKQSGKMRKQLSIGDSWRIHRASASTARRAHWAS